MLLGFNILFFAFYSPLLFCLPDDTTVLISQFSSVSVEFVIIVIVIRRPLQGLSGAVQSSVDNYTHKTNRKVLKTNCFEN